MSSSIDDDFNYSDTPYVFNANDTQSLFNVTPKESDYDGNMACSGHLSALCCHDDGNMACSGHLSALCCHDDGNMAGSGHLSALCCQNVRSNNESNVSYGGCHSTPRLHNESSGTKGVYDISSNKHSSIPCWQNESTADSIMLNVSSLNASLNVSQVSSAQNDSTAVEMFPALNMFREKHPKNFIFAHLNINWFHTKFAEVHEILSLNLVDLLFLGESKLYPTLNKSFKVENYTFYRQDRPGVTRSTAGGGLVAYVLSSIPHRERKDIAFNQDGIETMVFEVMMKKEKWFFILIYRPGSVAIRYLKSAIEYMCQRCNAEGKATFILGDINVDFLQHVTPLQDELDVFDLQNLVKGPTCFKNPENPTSVDVILTTCPRRVASSQNTNIGVSDHHNIVMGSTKMYASRCVKRHITYRSYRHFEEDKFLDDLICAPFQVSQVFDDINDQLWFHNKLFDNVINEHAPLKSRIVKSRQLPYMNGELRRAINVKGMLKRKKDRYPTKENKERFKRQNNHVTALKRISLKKYFDEKCSKFNNKNPGQFWDTVKPFLCDDTKSTTTINLREGDEVVTDTNEVCNIFNDYYINAVNDLCEDECVKLDGSIEHIEKVYANHPSVQAIKRNQETDSVTKFEFQLVTNEALCNKMKCLKSNKACGFDGQPPRLIKLGAPVLSLSMLPIVNLSISTSIFPCELKKAEISPVFKKDDRMNKEKFRPVSVLPAVSKPFECIMFDQLNVHFQNILSSFLAAYRKGYSTQHVLLKAIEDVKHSLDKNEHVAWVLMDLSKAFDALPHGLLISKLRAYGLSESACLFVSSYLSSRQQRVKIAGKRSNWEYIKRGVPQGSVLGPLLFNIFLNDIFYFLNDVCTLYNYADDNTLSYSHKDVKCIEERLSIASKVAIEWFKENFMKANAPKFQVAFFSRNNHIEGIHIELDDVTLYSTDCTKLLGLNIDRKLTFNYHISELCKKAARQLNGLIRLSTMLPKESKFNIFNAFIISNFLYCPIVWHLCSKSDTCKVEKIQERALRFIFRDFESEYQTLLVEAGRSSLYMDRLRLIVTEVYKILNGMSPVFLQEMLINKDNMYNFRDDNRLLMYKYDTVTYGKKSVSYEASILWNSIDANVKNVEGVEEFKRLIRHWNGPTCKCGECLICIFR